MSKEELDKYLKKFRQYKKRILASKESAQRFLIDVGIHDKNGELSKNYK